MFSIRSGYGLSAETSFEQNRHVRDGTDSLFVLRYDRLTFELDRPGPLDRKMLTVVSMTAADRPLPGGVRIGTTTRGDLAGDLVGDTLRRMRWIPYVD